MVYHYIPIGKVMVTHMNKIEFLADNVKLKKRADGTWDITFETGEDAKYAAAQLALVDQETELKITVEAKR